MQKIIFFGIVKSFIQMQWNGIDFTLPVSVSFSFAVTASSKIKFYFYLFRPKTAKAPRIKQKWREGKTKSDSYCSRFLSCREAHRFQTLSSFKACVSQGFASSVLCECFLCINVNHYTHTC